MRWIMVCKSGCAVYAQAYRGRRNGLGETGHVEAVIRRLTATGHGVRFVGAWHGPVPVEHMTVHPIDELVLPDGASGQQYAMFRRMADQVQDCAACVDFPGPDTNWFTIGNPDHVTLLDYICRHKACLGVAGELGIPRAVVVTDQRCYPCEMEWRRPTGRYPTLRPVALLSMVERERTRWGTSEPHLQREVEARPDFWASDIWPARSGQLLRDIPILFLGHHHVRTGFRQARRGAIFEALLGRAVGQVILKAAGARVVGEGWENHSDYDPELMTGPVPMGEVPELLERSWLVPMVSPEVDGKPTSKIRMASRYGAVSVPYGRGGPYTYDRRGRIVPLDSPWRAETLDDLLRLRDRSVFNLMDRAAELDRLTTPRYDLLDQLVDRLLGGADTTTDWWFRTFGGYRRI